MPQLIDSEAQFAYIKGVENAGLGLCWGPLDGPAHANPAMRRLLDLDQDDGPIELGDMLGQFAAGDRQELQAALNAVAKGSPPFRIELKRPPPAGSGGQPTFLSLHLMSEAAEDGERRLVMVCQNSSELFRLRESLTVTDTATRLHTRAYFNMHLEREWRISMRERMDLSLMLLEAEPAFPALELGEGILYQLGQVLNSAIVRPADFAARFTDTWMAVLLPRTNLVGARHVADRLWAYLKADPVISELQPGERPIMSLGVASLDPSATALGYEVLVSRAEAALHNCQLQGGGCIELWDPRMPEAPRDL